MKTLWAVFAVAAAVNSAGAQMPDSDEGVYEGARCSIKRTDGVELPGDFIKLHQASPPGAKDPQTREPYGFDWLSLTHIEGRGFGDSIARDKRTTSVGAVITLYQSDQESKVSVLYFKKPENTRAHAFAATWVLTDSAKKEGRVIELDCLPSPALIQP